ncbi:MAG: hypothetical protein ACI88A_001745 [Paraglaciecola sp.]|jgi:hypothetical protein
MIKFARVLQITVLIIFSASCTSSGKPCEEILEVKRQEQQCEQLRKVMDNNLYPQQAITARKNYQELCLDLRYYRDNYDTICKGNQRAIGEKEYALTP